MDINCWNTFIDYDYKVQINYPTELEFSKFDDNLYFEKKYIVYFSDVDDYGFTMRIEKNNDDVTYDNFNEWKDPVSEIKPREEKQIGEYKGIVIIERDGRESIGRYFHIMKDDKLIVFRMKYIEEDIENIKVFERMIESLKLF